VVTTLAGGAGSQGSDNGTNGAARFKYPTGVAVDSATNLYVADYLNALIRKITPVGTNWVVTTLAGFGGEFQYPDGVALDSAGNVYVTDEGIQTVQKITPAGVVTTLAGSVGLCGSADGTNSAARFCRPHGVAVDNATNIYVADYYTNTIRKLRPVGTNWVVTTLAGSPGMCGSADGLGSAALFCGPNGIAVDGANHLYVADGLNNRISKGTPSTLTISRQISNIVHHFNSGNRVTDEIIFDRAGLTNIDLSQYTTFELRLFAPAGQRIVVNAPTNFSSSVNLYYVAASDGSSTPTTNNTLSFENFSGILPTRTYSFFAIADAGNAVVFQADHSYTNVIEFTAMKYAFTPTYNPANSPKTFQLPGGGATNFLSFSYSTSQTTNPGSFVTLGQAMPLTPVIQPTSGNVNVSWLSKLNEHYQVQCVTNLMASNNWINFGSEIIGDGLTKFVSDSTTNRPAKYYRIKILP
jgi:sugar lactone lactonase YvrE